MTGISSTIQDVEAKIKALNNENDRSKQNSEAIEIIGALWQQLEQN